MVNLDNLTPFQKGYYDPEKHRESRVKAGKKSGEARKMHGMLKRSYEKVLAAKPKGDLLNAMIAMGYKESGMCNADVLWQTIFAQAAQGNAKAQEILLEYGFKLSEEERKTVESTARVNAMKSNMGDLTIESGDDDEGSVVIYLPKQQTEEELVEDKADEP